MKICLNCSEEIKSKRCDAKFCSNKCRNNHNNVNNYSKHIFRVTKKRALDNDIPFNLTEHDFIIPDVCPILDIPLFRGKGSMSNNSPSIDKIIPELGYIKGNVWIISMRANRLKSDLSKEDLIKFCTKLLKKIENIEIVDNCEDSRLNDK